MLWRNPAIPDRLRAEALHEMFARVDVQGSLLLAVHPQPNENAGLLGPAALRQEQHVGMVGARGLNLPRSSMMGAAVTPAGRLSELGPVGAQRMRHQGRPAAR